MPPERAGKVATYNLVYLDDEYGVARRVEFEAMDPCGALRLAQNQAVGRTAELWLGSRKLCTLRRTGRSGEVWEVGPGSGTGRSQPPPADRTAAVEGEVSAA